MGLEGCEVRGYFRCADVKEFEGYRVWSLGVLGVGGDR